MQGREGVKVMVKTDKRLGVGVQGKLDPNMLTWTPIQIAIKNWRMCELFYDDEASTTAPTYTAVELPTRSP